MPVGQMPARQLGGRAIGQIRAVALAGVDDQHARPRGQRVEHPRGRRDGAPQQRHVVAERLAEATRVDEVALHVDHDQRGRRGVELERVRLRVYLGHHASYSSTNVRAPSRQPARRPGTLRDVMTTSSPPRSRNSMAARILGPMLPSGNSPAARCARISAQARRDPSCADRAADSAPPPARRPSRSPASARPGWPRDTPRPGLCRSRPRRRDRRPAPPRRPGSRRRRRRRRRSPPRAAARWRRASTMPPGCGDGTTRRYPRPASSTMLQPSRARALGLLDAENAGPIGLVGRAKAGSSPSTTVCVSRQTDPVGQAAPRRARCDSAVADDVADAALGVGHAHVERQPRNERRARRPAPSAAG